MNRITKSGNMTDYLFLCVFHSFGITVFVFGMFGKVGVL